MIKIEDSDSETKILGFLEADEIKYSEDVFSFLNKHRENITNPDILALLPLFKNTLLKWVARAILNETDFVDRATIKLLEIFFLEPAADASGVFSAFAKNTDIATLSERLTELDQNMAKTAKKLLTKFELMPVQNKVFELESRIKELEKVNRKPASKNKKR